MKNKKAIPVKHPSQPFKNESPEMSEQQLNPGLADPNDFVVENQLSFTGQEGKNARENAAISSRSPKPHTSLNNRNRPGGSRDGKKYFVGNE
jgi:hypothetical protein